MIPYVPDFNGDIKQRSIFVVVLLVLLTLLCFCLDK